MKISPNDPCPCHSGMKYKKCCRPLHNGNPAPTPEALMRSRYSAYALGLSNYIMDSTHPDSPHAKPNREQWRGEIDDFSGARFTGLDILQVGEDTVTFRATIFDGDEDISFTEKSLFRQHNDRWKYVEAVK